jgi:hypothetical protein
MQEGDVGVILSPLYLPFDEIDFARRYGSKPRPGYFTELLTSSCSWRTTSKNAAMKGVG